MGQLTCDLFTKPPNDELEACAVEDADHVTPGSVGDHVKLIQIALNQLSNVFLGIDGIYGPRTAAAVVAFKEAQSPPLRQPGQSRADNIVGIRTIQALDEQMFELQNAPKRKTGLISEDDFGTPHDHKNICVPFLDSDTGPDHLITHIGTPINPQGTGRMICIGGTNEVKYLNFENVMPDPKLDPAPGLAEFVRGRRLTSSIPSHTCSDICFRFAPVDDFMKNGDGKRNKGELKRLARPGCRLTVATSNPAAMAGHMPFLLSLGPQLQFAAIPDRNRGPQGPLDDLDRITPAVVILMLNVFQPGEKR